MIRIGKPNKMQKTEPEFIKNYKSYLPKTRYAQNKNEGTKNIAKNSKTWITFCTLSLFRYCFLHPKALHVSKHHAKLQTCTRNTLFHNFFQIGTLWSGHWAAAPPQKNIHKMPSNRFFGVGIFCTCRYDPILSWKTVPGSLEMASIPARHCFLMPNTFFPNNTPNLPNFGMKFGTQNTQVPPVFSV